MQRWEEIVYFRVVLRIIEDFDCVNEVFSLNHGRYVTYGITELEPILYVVYER